MDYTFFDVETPNRYQDRICSIGVVQTDGDGNIKIADHYLVNPEQKFDARISQIHGLCESDVQNAPTFDSLWLTTLSDIFEGSVVVAHNASFDMRVLNKCLLAYELPFFDTTHLCTKNLARRFNIPSPDYQLPSLCDYFNVKLDNHHNALSDAFACAQIFWAMLSETKNPCPKGIPYIWDQNAKSNHIADNTTQAMMDLYGIVIGISMDGYISANENSALVDWQSRYEGNRRAPFFSDLFTFIDAALSDGTLSSEERNSIINMTTPFVSNNNCSPQTFAMQQLIGILRGISSDGVVNEIEANNLKSWLDESSDLNIPEFSKISHEVTQILADGVITEAENSHIISVFDRIINPVESNTNHSIQFDSSKFCLTGDFAHGSKGEIESLIEAHGGEIANNVSGKIAYLIVGGKGSSQYAFGNYGTKVKKALELIDKGKPIQIITEDTLFEAL